MFASKLKNQITLLLILLSWIIGSAHGEPNKCKVNGAIVYSDKKCPKGSELDINVPLNIPKVPDYKAIEAEKLAKQQQQEVINRYKQELIRHKNMLRRQQNKLNELRRNREDAIQLLKLRAQRLNGGDASAMQLRKELGQQISSSREHYDQQINITKHNLSKASNALKDFLSKPKPEGYDPAELQTAVETQ